MKLKCNCKYETKCSHNFCKTCCYNNKTYIDCLMHKKYACKCGNFDNIITCDNKCCKECCFTINKHCNLHKTKCICGKTFSPSCINKLCKKCCSGIDCSIHKYKLDLCKCMYVNFEDNCIDKLCINCCNNNNCSLHYIYCKCNIKVKKNTCCETKSCSPYCCIDPYCNSHFDIGDITNDDIINYKLLLNSCKIELPDEIIDIIVDGFIDNRVKCIICNTKYNIGDKDYDFLQCHNCNNYMCDNQSDCMEITFNKHTNYYFCMNCYDGTSHNSSDDNCSSNNSSVSDNDNSSVSDNDNNSDDNNNNINYNNSSDSDDNSLDSEIVIL